VHYRQIWQQHTGLKIPRGWHIHHIDGNSHNHEPENLNCVSPTMHWWAHWLRGDPVAFKGKFIQGAAKASCLAGVTNRGDVWVTYIETKECRHVSKQEADVLTALGKWTRGRAKGGFNSWDQEKATAVRSAGGKTRAAMRWSDLEQRKRNGEITKERWANPEYKAGIAKKISEWRRGYR
jgi:hypothetical protein